MGVTPEGVAEEGVAESIKDWGVREDMVEESVAEESLAEVRGLEAGVVVRQESVGEQIKNCVDKLRPVPLGRDICDCGNAPLIACLAHTHKN